MVTALAKALAINTLSPITPCSGAFALYALMTLPVIGFKPGINILKELLLCNFFNISPSFAPTTPSTISVFLLRYFLVLFLCPWYLVTSFMATSKSAVNPLTSDILDSFIIEYKASLSSIPAKSPLPLLASNILFRDLPLSDSDSNAEDIDLLKLSVDAARSEYIASLSISC